VEQEHFLALEGQAIDHELQRPVAHADETYEASKNIDAAKAAASSDEMFATKATLLGMEELVPGALWKGTRRQINEALDHQSPRPKVLHEGPKWKLQLRDRVIEVSEVSESSPSKAEMHDANSVDADKESRAAAAVPHSEFTGRSPSGRSRARVPIAAIHQAAESAITILNGPIGGDFAMTHDNRAITLNTGREWARIDIDVDNTGNAVATHTYTRGNARAHIIISEEARGDDLVRALAHELAEIRALMADGARNLSDPDALTVGSVSEQLSHHDVGRKAELQVLLYELQSRPEHAVEIKAEIRALVSHLGFELEGIAKSARARKLLGNDVVNSLSAFTSRKRVPVDVESVKITPGIRAAEWYVSIDATLPNGNIVHLGDGSVLLDKTGRPESGPSFYLDKRTSIGDEPARVDFMRGREKIPMTQFAIIETIKLFEKQFGHPPTELPGSLASDNREIFQRAYLALIDQGIAPHDAAHQAAMKTPFVDNRVKLGFNKVEVITSPMLDRIVYGDPPRVREVPHTAEIVARKA